MFFVYEWYNIDTGEIFYVGKGTRNRHKVRKHNKFFNDYISRHNCESRIIREFENEQDAFAYEYERVSELKSQNQCVCNIYDGGFGGTTGWWTDSLREKYSKHNVMKSKAQRERMIQHNPMKRKEISEKVNSPKRKPVIIGEKEHQSVKAAALYYKVSEQTVIEWCRKGINCNFEKCRYKGEPQNEYNFRRYNKGGSKPLIYKGKIYEAAIDLARELSISNNTVCRWAKNGFDPDGNECRFVDDHTEHVYKKHINGEASRKAIYVNGVLYQSKADAERRLGLCKGYLAPYIAGTRKNNKYICEYADQQPSRGNTDNSTPEGSETNR